MSRRNPIETHSPAELAAVYLILDSHLAEIQEASSGAVEQLVHTIRELAARVSDERVRKDMLEALFEFDRKIEESDQRGQRWCEDAEETSVIFIRAAEAKAAIVSAALENTQKRREGALAATASKKKWIRETLDPLVREIWKALPEAERSVAGLRFELAKRGIRRSEFSLRLDLKRLNLSISLAK
jgi:hypothetical protein